MYEACIALHSTYVRTYVKTGDHSILFDDVKRENKRFNNKKGQNK